MTTPPITTAAECYRDRILDDVIAMILRDRSERIARLEATTSWTTIQRRIASFVVCSIASPRERDETWIHRWPNYDES